MSLNNTTNNNKLWTKNFISISIVNLLISVSGNMLISAFPLYLVSLGGSSITVGVASSFFAVFALIMRPVSGWLLDHHNRKFIFFFGIIGMIVVPGLYVLLPMIIAAIILRSLHGIFWASSTTAASTNVCDILPRSRFGEGLSMYSISNSLSMIIGPAFGLLLWNKLGSFPLFITIAGIGLLALIFLSRFEFSKNIIKTQQPAINRNLSTTVNSLFEKKALPAAAMVSFMCIPSGAINSFMALHTMETGIGNGGLYFTFQAIGATLPRLFAGRLLDIYGEASAIYVSFACFVSGMICFLFAQAAWVFYIGAFLYGLGYGLSMPALQTMSMSTVAPERRGAASSLYLCSFDASIGLGGLLGGFVSHHVGYTNMFMILGTGLFGFLFLYHFWVRYTPVVAKPKQRKINQ